MSLGGILIYLLIGTIFVVWLGAWGLLIPIAAIGLLVILVVIGITRGAS